MACQAGQPEIVNALIKVGGEAILSQASMGGCSCLDGACGKGHVEIVKALIEAGGEALLLKPTRTGPPASMSRVKKGMLRSQFIDSQRLSSRRAGGALPLRLGSSCLHIARVAVVRLLLSFPCAALVSLRDRAGRRGTALDLAFAGGQAGAAEAILANLGLTSMARGLRA